MSADPIAASAVLAAPADRVYAAIADYRDAHPRILPRPEFVDLEVEAGGYGAGTRIRYSMRAFGRTRSGRAEISEPEPGRVLVERDATNDLVTTFIVEPVDAPAGAESPRTRVTISTELRVSRNGRGLATRLERALAAPFLRKLYLRELAQLEVVASEHAVVARG